jgi:hypothetical protein
MLSNSFTGISGDMTSLVMESLTSMGTEEPEKNKFLVYLNSS